MKSPFPGMDPYIERYWHEVHHRLITYAGDELQVRLPPHLSARIEERVAPNQALYDFATLEIARRRDAAAQSRRDS